MTSLSFPSSPAGDRFPGFNVMDQASHWDATTSDLITARLLAPPPIRFFSPQEEATAGALFDQLLDQHGDTRVPVVNMVDARLFEGQTDGWHYEAMPVDAVSWQRSLAGLDRDSEKQFAVPFPDAALNDQETLLRQVQSHDGSPWHGLNASHIWDLWMRYACTAFYSHPLAWSEIGFDGPAYPRGYKNLGVDRREPFEVADARPRLDPAAGEQS